jgi:hypothetical protein
MSLLPVEDAEPETGDSATVRPEALPKPEPGDYFKPFNVSDREPTYAQLLATPLALF